LLRRRRDNGLRCTSFRPIHRGWSSQWFLDLTSQARINLERIPSARRHVPFRPTLYGKMLRFHSPRNLSVKTFHGPMLRGRACLVQKRHVRKHRGRPSPTRNQARMRLGQHRDGPILSHGPQLSLNPKVRSRGKRRRRSLASGSRGNTPLQHLARQRSGKSLGRKSRRTKSIDKLDRSIASTKKRTGGRRKPSPGFALTSEQSSAEAVATERLALYSLPALSSLEDPAQ